MSADVSHLDEVEDRQSDPVVPGSAARLAGLGPSLVVAIAAALVFLAVRGSLIDDTYITLDYARNVAFHLHWGLIQAGTSNTATSALNVLLLALFTVIVRDPVTALGVLFVLSTVALEYGLRRVARAVGLPAWSALLATGLVLVNPLLISSIGLETALGAGLLGLLLAAAVERRPVWFGVLAGLLMLTRPDLLLVALVVFFARRGWYRGWWRSLLALVTVTLPWYLWSWLVLGSALPDTLIIKTSQHAWGDWQFGNGLRLYFIVYPTATALAVLPAALGLLAALCWLVLRFTRRTERVRRLDALAPLALAGVLHFAAYSALGVPPYHWYYGPSLVCLTVFLAGAVATLWPDRAVVRPLWTRPVGVGLVLAAVLLAGADLGNYTAGGLPRGFTPINSNWAASAEYQRIGATVGKLVGDQGVRSAGEIGTLAYYCDCAVVDDFSDRAEAATIIAGREAATGPATRALLRLNFHFLDRSVRPIATPYWLDLSSTPPTNAIATWPISSSWVGPHYLALMRTSP